MLYKLKLGFWGFGEQYVTERSTLTKAIMYCCERKTFVVHDSQQLGLQANSAGTAPALPALQAASWLLS